MIRRVFFALVVLSGCAADVFVVAADAGRDRSVVDAVDAAEAPDTSPMPWLDAGAPPDVIAAKDSSPHYCALEAYNATPTYPQLCHVEDVPECNTQCPDGEGGAYQYGVACQADTVPHGPARFRRAIEPDGGKQWKRFCGNADYCQPNYKSVQCMAYLDGGFPYEWTCAEKRLPGPMMPDGCEVEITCATTGHLSGDTFCSAVSPQF